MCAACEFLVSGTCVFLFVVCALSSIEKGHSKTSLLLLLLTFCHNQVCLDVFVEVPAKSTPATGRRERSKRSVTYTPTTLTPRMFTVAVVGSTPINSPPTIQNVTLVLLEDDLNSGITLSYTDDENDVLSFSILQQPMHGTVIVTSDGHVTYTPAGNYSGGDVIVLQGIEVLDAASVAAGMVPNVVNFSLAVSVLAVNDPPDVFYLTGNS